MRHLVEEAGLAGRIEIDSCGTGAYHVGAPPDDRATAAARKRGIELSGRARQLRAADFEHFDYILAMDRSNLADLRAMAPSSEAFEKARLLRSFDPLAKQGAPVKDPYYGGDQGFEEVLDVCHAACSALLEQIRRDHGI